MTDTCVQVPKTAGPLVKQCIADHLLVVTWDLEAHLLCQRLHHPLLCFQVAPERLGSYCSPIPGLATHWHLYPGRSGLCLPSLSMPLCRYIDQVTIRHTVC